MKPYPMNEPNKEEQEKKKAELERLLHHKTVDALRELEALIDAHLNEANTEDSAEESSKTDEDVGQ